MESMRPAPACRERRSPQSTDVRRGMSAADLKQAFLDNLECALGRVPLDRVPQRRVHRSGA